MSIHRETRLPESRKPPATILWSRSPSPPPALTAPALPLPTPAVGDTLTVVGYGGQTKEEASVRLGRWELFNYVGLEFAEIESEFDSIDVEPGDSGGALLLGNQVVGIVAARGVPERTLMGPWFLSGAAEVFNTVPLN